MELSQRMNIATLIITIVLVNTYFVECFDENNNLNATNRNAKAVSVFQVVRFPNVACVGTSSLNGTCFTSSECINNGGTASGTCANGFGVCCIFTLGCGGVANQNCTFFRSSVGTAINSGSCGIKVCKCSSDICQLRVDFNNFVIAGPNTLATTVGKTIFGIENTVNTGVAVSQLTQCNTDTFTITGPAGSTPPVICGTNTGQHVYVDASDMCNTMNFELGSAPVGIGTIPTRSWQLKITQISCFDIGKLAPSGCTQYFQGTTGRFQSFNFLNDNPVGSVQLANQNQRICFRREKNICRICYSQVRLTDFAVSGIAGIGQTTGCCNYGTDGKKTNGYDCVMIPGATSFTLKKQIAATFCGGRLVTVGNNDLALTVCTTQTPFQFNFVTDNFTFQNANARGFQLIFQQIACAA